ncbi:2-dehydro-3-deoxygluconokinase [Bacillus sp. AFS077874]|uniref:sugar kinase n=1 Tax=unclassified Bacillus (in: firmicutes) TaxID=185979 RepID=UPI000BEBBAED|nr:MULTISPECIES: sugar kinase [unclassified Bacillus (in: firmicutes)]PEC50980.1 2-dehydro-3-deoxygluconokinase [Bacillus sp. AFS096315]PET76357.1 2-dehydro-3-deoxygluconokinase [Bacillus sp. AFS001701]PFM83228.1 2-dehydro-3-deoxygluconokinase [Bacillus sp. AFS077874]
MEKLDVITFGEAMAMFIADKPGFLHEIDQFTRELAGAETNVAIGLTKLGLRSGWASKVGNDAFGKFIINRLKCENVDIEHVLVDDRHPTGFQLKSKVVEGDPEVQYFRKGSAASHLSVDDFNEKYFQLANFLHMTGIPLAISEQARAFANHALSFMKKNGRKVSFDPNLRPSLWASQEEMVEQINKTAFQADYVFPGIAEGELLTGYKNPSDIASFYLEKGVELVVIKLGEEGAFYKTSSENGIVPGFKVEKVVDTVGAGDGFAVGVISGLIESLSIYESVLRGNAIGALAVQTPGDNDGYPSKRELLDYIKNNLQGVE